jgi:hypothetical protein
MSFKIKVSSNTQKAKVNVAYTVEFMPQNLDELNDVSISEVSGNQDKYVLVYNSSNQKWEAVNPDVILSASATEPIQPGLPQDLISKLDIDLDDKIDLDGGQF